jgi:integrase
MSKTRSTPPKMSRNGSTAFMRIDGKRIYLGKFGSAEADKNYARCVAEWASSRGIPKEWVAPTGSITVDSLSTAFLESMRKNGLPPHYYAYRTAIKMLLELYSGVSVDSFSPKCLAAIQYHCTQYVGKHGKRYSRQYCNSLIKHIRSMFRWGVAQELVSSVTADALRYVPSLHRGRTVAPESKPREDIPDVVVDATLPYLLPTVAAMVQVQRWAVMRPNEVCRMCVGHIDRSRKDGIWIYRPPLHKGTWRGHGKAVPLGKPEQALLLPYIEGRVPEQAVFSPMNAMAEKKGPNTKSKGRKKSTAPSKQFQEHYNTRSSGRAIERAIKKANQSLPKDQQIPHWTPYQLRHAGITELVYENNGNLEIARAVAGQRSVAVTQGYNHADLDIAIEQAKKLTSR